MKYLLDTCTFLWIIQGNLDELSTHAVKVYRDTKNEVFLSSISSWEIVIKSELRKVTFDGDISERLPEEIEKTGCQRLPVYHSHALAVNRLKAIHSDPFDRMLLAQAQVEDLTLLTPDSAIGKYEVPVEW